MYKRIVPLLDRVLVQRSRAPEKTASGLLIPERAKNKLNEGQVLAVGPGGRDSHGNLIPVAVQVGDTVLLPEYGGSTIKLGDQDEVRKGPRAEANEGLGAETREGFGA